MKITPDQIRAARALLKWGQDELSKRSGVSVPAIANIENEKQQASTNTIYKFLTAFEDAGVEFIDDGVRRTNNIVQVLRGEDANARLLEQIYASVKEMGGGEILIAGLKELEENESEKRSFVIAHLERLKKIGVTERILIEKGDTNFLAPKSWYRYLPSEFFSPYPFQLFNKKLALINWGPPLEIVIIDSPFITKSFEKLFNFAWEHAEIPR